VPVQVMGEGLVLFRDEQGRPGLLGRHCSHRGADLSYGRLEDGGLRCLYHGWLYDVAGRCLEQPGEPAGSTFKDRVRQRAYPCVEKARVIFAYLGPGEPPSLPNYGFFTVPDDHVLPTKLYHEANFQQGHEGNLDLVHVSLLHLTSRDYQARVLEPSEKLSSRGGAPNLESMDTEFTPTGLRYCKLRQLPNGDRYIRTAEFVLPNSIAVPAVQENGLGYLVNWHVPIDDAHHWKYMFQFNWERPLDPEAVRADRYAYMTPDYRSTRNKANRYLQDRQEMVSESYTGMGFQFNVHDLWAVEGQGPVQDRTQEHLAPSDIALAQGRHLVLDWIRRVRAGEAPPQFEVDPALGRPKKAVSLYGTIPASTHWAAYCRERE